MNYLFLTHEANSIVEKKISFFVDSLYCSTTLRNILSHRMASHHSKRANYFFFLNFTAFVSVLKPKNKNLITRINIRINHETNFLKKKNYAFSLHSI